jgi:arylsulfatase A-like enzyme
MTLFPYPTLIFVILCLGMAACGPRKQTPGAPAPKPNILLIYLDDLGYGDVSAYGAGTLPTPNMDRLAKGGVMFTQGYAASATCTPSRFALLTGTYPWRNKNAKILPGTAPLLIDTLQMTLPKMLQEVGYYTGVVGKWHLGLGLGEVDWNGYIYPGPNQVGFNYSYIMAATQDRVPTVYIENGYINNLDPADPVYVDYNQNFPGEPTGLENPELLTMKWHHGHNNSIVNGIPRIGFMKGGEKAKWSDVDMADHFLEKGKEFLKRKRQPEQPFFLFFTMQQPHVPRTPHPRFAGLSGMGPRGDVILEADWVIGELLNILERQQLLENTLVIVSSDNGPVLNDGYYDDAVELLGNHTPAGPLRGGKYSLFEAGTRVPFITYWKETISPTVSNAMVTQIDLLASIAALVGGKIPATTDSENLCEVLLGKSMQGREDFVLEATSRTAYRHHEWVLIPPYPSYPAVHPNVQIELGNAGSYQLFNLAADPGQQENLAASNPEKLQEMIARYVGRRNP